MQTWQLHEAKNRFSDLFDEAHESGPQRVTRHGKKAVIVVSEAEWQRVTKNIPSFGELLAACPIAREDLPPFCRFMAARSSRSTARSRFAPASSWQRRRPTGSRSPRRTR